MYIYYLSVVLIHLVIKINDISAITIPIMTIHTNTALTEAVIEILSKTNEKQNRKTYSYIIYIYIYIYI